MADSIQPGGGIASSPAGGNSPGGLPGGSNSGYQGYFSSDSSGYSTPLDGPDFVGLGTGPGIFLFGPNTMYSFTGIPVITILSTNANPGQSVLPLNGPGTQQFSFTFPNPENQTLPEPRSFVLCFTALAALYFVYRRRVSAR